VRNAVKGIHNTDVVGSNSLFHTRQGMPKFCHFNCIQAP
jgi:hypothetical protein